jgi:hypothetical protein
LGQNGNLDLIQQAATKDARCETVGDVADDPSSRIEFFCLTFLPLSPSSSSSPVDRGRKQLGSLTCLCGQSCACFVHSHHHRPWRAQEFEATRRTNSAPSFSFFSEINYAIRFG